MTKRQTLYPPIEPYQTGRLTVSEVHELYYEVSGNPDGQPVIVCHGGPGGGATPSMRRYFNPQAYKIILFDQRGCGRSTPHASLADNNTWALVSDMEKLRTELGVETWMVFGGSWGSTLALAYAQTHEDRVHSLVLRGIFTLRREELMWFYQEGASWIYPDAWEAFITPIPDNERDDLITAYYRRLTGEDRKAQVEAARTWSVWEGSTVSLFQSQDRMAAFASDHFAIAFARIECHYFVHGGFFDRDDQIIANMDRIAHIPGVIVQGRHDVVTPMKTAWALHKAWPTASLEIIDDAGHAASEPGVIDALLRATDRLSQA